MTVYFLLLVSAILLSCSQNSSVDFLIQNGTPIDGLGNPVIQSDLLIQNGRMKIVNQGESLVAVQTIDATGLIVSPGFIDVHNHSDQRINKESLPVQAGLFN
jgi:N-acyl-D-aspartate/D-glutamate deacylase